MVNNIWGGYKMKILDNKYITDVPGFKAAGISSGVKTSGKKDLCVIYSEVTAVAAATLTTNKVKAAPLQVNIKHLQGDRIQAIVVNSGNANACTGAQGLRDAESMAEITADCLNLSPEEVLVASTGIIGKPMPMDKITAGIKVACKQLSKKGGYDAALAIMTTDTITKTITVEFTIKNKPIYISAIAKGSGMIHPNMATMLSFIVTNVNIEKDTLSSILKSSVQDSYNMITVDGDTSTNDMVIALANGLAENPIIDQENDDYHIFKNALDFVNVELSKLIAKDGEGATKLIEVNVLNAVSSKDAKLCAKSVVSSNLVKSAFFGSDANWGRIMCSLGYSKGNFDPDKVDIAFENSIGKIYLVQDGISVLFSEEKAKEILSQDFIRVIIDLKDGSYKATAWGCDLTYDYVKINGSYRT
jgi:glutamate N-acetyltransferase/amino-acid N-acetyltransferase